MVTRWEAGKKHDRLQATGDDVSITLHHQCGSMVIVSQEF